MIYNTLYSIVEGFTGVKIKEQVLNLIHVNP